MADHNDNKIHISQKLIQIVVLVLDDIFCYKGVVNLQWFCQMLLLVFQ